MIQRADSEYLRRLFIRAEAGGFWHRHHQGVDPYTPSAVALGAPAVPAKVQASRWIVECPSPTCTGAQLASPELALFFCVDCLNADVAHTWIEVLWPSDRAITAIEAALVVRPDFFSRSWDPGQSVSDLVFENHFYGDLVDTSSGRVLGDTGFTDDVPLLPRRSALALQRGSN